MTTSFTTNMTQMDPFEISLEKRQVIVEKSDLIIRKHDSLGILVDVSILTRMRMDDYALLKRTEEQWTAKLYKLRTRFGVFAELTFGSVRLVRMPIEVLEDWASLVITYIHYPAE